MLYHLRDTLYRLSGTGSPAVGTDYQHIRRLVGLRRGGAEQHMYTGAGLCQSTTCIVGTGKVIGDDQHRGFPY